MRSEVLVAMSPGRDFHFDCMPMTAPSSPKSFGFFCDYSSAPTSPTRAASIYSHFSQENVDQFSFGFAEQQEVGSLALTPADELFEAGKIRSMQGERGRQRDTASSSRRASRSLSPMIRAEDISQKSAIFSHPPSTTNSTPDIKRGGSKRWRIRDLLLFRSASEGRATGRESKDPLRKFSVPSGSSFRKTERGKSGPAVSATEIHYKENRALYEEQKKKTALPYNRNGLFGYLRFNPAINSISRGLNSRGRP